MESDSQVLQSISKKENERKPKKQYVFLSSDLMQHSQLLKFVIELGKDIEVLKEMQDITESGNR